jgi:hypothetical protein
MTQPMFVAQETGRVEIRLGSVSVEFEVREGDQLVLQSSDKWERCARCNGTGFLVRGSVYCECPLGRDLWQVEQNRGIASTINRD